MQQGRQREAADILISILTKAVESKIQLEGRMIPSFIDMVYTGLVVIDLLPENEYTPQSQAGLSIAELFVQMIELAHTASRRLCHVTLLYDLSIIFEVLGNPRKASDLLQEVLGNTALKDNTLQEGETRYKIILATARQGRIDGARRYMSQYLALIALEKARYGNLDIWLGLDRYDGKKALR